MHRSPPPRSLAEPDAARSRVLIIAEGSSLREDLARLLGAHAVTAVEGRRAAIEAARRDPPDLILAALGPLPEGLALIRDLREAPPTAVAPIIAIAASSGAGALVEGLRMGADDWVELPFRPEDLLARVEARLRTARFHRDAEQTLLEWNNRYEATIRATGHLLYDWDPRTNAVIYGGDSEGVTGYALDEMGDGLAEWIEIIHPEDRAAFIGEVDRVMRTKSPFDMSYRVTQKSGRVIHCADRGFFFYDAAGNIARMVGFVADVTARKRLEQERDALLSAEQKARAEAERSSRLKDEFLGVISHELRTPLSAVLGWTRMLRAGTLAPDRAAHALETIERNARNQARLIEDLLDVSRITSGKLRLEMVPVRPIHVVEAALESTRPAAEAQGLRVEADLDPRAGPILGDPDRLQQVIWNLLSNAVKFTPRGGKIAVGLRRAGDAVEIAVADTGQGIRPDFLPHVFERFRQGDASTTRAHGGLGLGLAIVHHLIELHGGSIRAESEGIGRGATFTVSLPRAPALAGAEIERPGVRVSPQPFGCPVSLAGLRVLVVDDEEDTRSLLVSILEQCEAEVEAVPGAAEAMEKLRGRRPDVLLSDIAMPGEDGLALMRRIRALSPDQGGRVAAVAITALARAEDRTRALRAGFNLHLPKPVDPAELLVAIANVTGRLSMA